MGKAIRNLGMKSRACPPCQLLTDKNRENRLARGKKIVNWLKLHPGTVKIFSDKKLFTVDQAYNRRNDRHISKTAAETKPVSHFKHPQSVMLLSVVASNGKKMPAFFRASRTTRRSLGGKDLLFGTVPAQQV